MRTFKISHFNPHDPLLENQEEGGGRTEVLRLQVQPETRTLTLISSAPQGGGYQMLPGITLYPEGQNSVPKN